MDNIPMENFDFKARTSIDFLLRTTQQNHIQLSLMADQKANIIVAFNSVIFSVSLSQMSQMKLPLGFVILACSSAASMIAAILALIPRFKKKKHRKKDFAVNPLFFGYFTELSEEGYIEYMESLLTNDKDIYETIMRDIYQSGLILKNKKYKNLRISYLLFFAGVCLSLAAFLAELFFFS